MRLLVERWRTEEGAALAEEVLARLIAGRPLTGLGLGEHEGRVDLRGLPAPQPRRLQRFETQGWFVEQLGDLVKFRGVRLENLDLSGAALESFRFYDAVVTGCCFDGASCRDWRLWGSDVSDSSFVGADLRESAVGTWHEGHRNSWRRADFSGADFRVGVSWEAVYEDCDFSGAKLAKVKFEQCTLARCRFSGELREVVFDGRDLTDRPAPPEMDKVDFSEATFRHVEFLGFDLEAAAGQVVGAHQRVLAGQRRARAPTYDQLTVGSCVAAETAPAATAGEPAGVSMGPGAAHISDPALSGVADLEPVPDPEPVYKPTGGMDRTSPWYVSYQDADGNLQTVGNEDGVHAEQRIQQMQPGSQMSRPFGWRGGEWVPGTVCASCQEIPRWQFPPNVEGAPGGPWGDG
jgi:uncharacterized protein YjbI with pentapeptide repeats